MDDDAMLRDAIVRDFKRRGYRTLTAGSGREAFEIASREKIDLVISDVRMPDGDGVELLTRLKAVDVDLPFVIFVTGFDDLTLEEAYEKGADAVFAKPFDRKALQSAVERALLSRSERWIPREPRLDASFAIELKFPSLDDAFEARLLNVGRGGFFAMLTSPLPVVGTTVAFKIDFNAPAPGLIEGRGVVRWRRVKSAEGYGSGIGAEFLDLSDGSRQQVVELLDRLKTVYFIPRT